ncbi:MAG: sulfite exporter TauE/SafE family protein [Hyphomicrobiales bacterium]|nr:MAG: sulfite exporter TauE/SafE family protein [Hyphomicrobiales bacterium]
MSFVFEPAFAVLALAVVTAGLVRGFSGFGTGLIFMPVASSVIDPLMAIVIAWAIDTLPTAPIVIPALKRCTWKTIRPMLVGAFVALPLGVAALRYADPVPARWAISLLTLGFALVLWSGWRYRSKPPTPLVLGVGATAGFLGGFAGIPGPPVILFWMSSAAAAIARANIIVFFAVLTVFSGSNYFLQGLFTKEALLHGLALAPIYFLALVAGNKLFPYAAEETYRRIAFSLIILSAIIGLPALDAILR